MKKFVVQMAVLLAALMPVVAQAENVGPTYGHIYLEIYKDGKLSGTAEDQGTSAYSVSEIADIDEGAYGWTKTDIYHEGGFPVIGGIIATYDGCPYVVTPEEGYAVYERRYFTMHTYAVEYKPGSQGTPSTTYSATKKHVEALTLKGETYTRTGYKQTGWSTSEGGDKQYELGERYTKNEPVTLYPYWTANAYKVTLNKNGGTCEDLTSYTYGVGATLPTATKSECTFNGWYDNSGFSGSSVKEISKTATGDKEFWAKFTTNQYTITTTVTPSGSGTVEVWPTGSPQPSGTKIEIKAYPKEKYAFEKWVSMPQSEPIYQNPYTFTITNNVQFRAFFTNKVFTVKFDPTGGECSETSRVVTAGDSIGELPIPTYEFHKFEGWYDDPVQTSTPIKQGTIVNGNMTAYAHWGDVPTHTIAVFANPEKGGTVLGDGEYGHGTVATVEAKANTGYTFTSWEHGETAAKFMTNVVADATYTANFKANTYTVMFNPNSGSCPEFSRTVTYDSTYGAEKPLPVPERSGFIFDGWYDGTNRITDDTVVKIATDPTVPQVLVAHWSEPKSYTVTFDGNGATSGSMTPQSIPRDEKTALKTNEYARIGYTFRQWKDLNGKTYQDKAEVLNLAGAGETVSLFAEWNANRYAISFNGNGATGGSMSSLTDCQYDKDVKLTANGYVRDGYGFSGWATNQSGAVVFADKATVRNLTAKNNETVTLYAQWHIHKNTVHFDGNGSTGGTMVDQVFEHGVTNALSKNLFTKTGYTFQGWTNMTKKVFYIDEQKVAFTDPDGTIHELKAVWAANSYTVAFDANGGEGSMDPLDCRYDKESTLPANEFTKTGCNFMGWATNLTSGVVFADGAKVKNLTAQAEGEVTLYAQWSYSLCYVDFKANGGEGKMAVQTFTNGIAQALLPNQFEKANYTFQGWTNELKKTFYADKQVVTFNEPDNTTNMLKAVWAVNTYTMHFEPNAKTALNPTAQSDISNCVSGVGVELPKCQYINLPSQGFLGWVDKNSVTNQAGAPVTNTVAKSGDVVTYKAAWEDNSALSKAVGLDTVTALTNQAGEASAYWKVSKEGARSGEKCVCYEIPTSQGSVPNLKMSMLVNGPGTLTFWYKKSAAVVNWDYLALEIDGKEKMKLSNSATTEYQDCKYKLEDTGLHTVTWDCWSDGDNSDGRIFYIDDVTWTPKGGKPKPLILFIR